MAAQTKTTTLPVNDTQAVIMDWVKATEEFYQRYYQITEVINAMNRSRYGRSVKNKQTGISNRSSVNDLMKLRQQMSDVLTTLLVDMTGTKPSRQAGPSKPGQLINHTKLLNELNKDIASQLSQFSGNSGQAQA